MKMDPLPDEATQVDQNRAINQLHECMHETQGRVEAAISMIAKISERMGVREDAHKQKPISDAPSLWQVYMTAGGAVVMSAGLWRILLWLWPFALRLWP